MRYRDDKVLGSLGSVGTVFRPACPLTVVLHVYCRAVLFSLLEAACPLQMVPLIVYVLHHALGFLLRAQWTVWSVGDLLRTWLLYDICMHVRVWRTCSGVHPDLSMRAVMSAPLVAMRVTMAALLASAAACRGDVVRLLRKDAKPCLVLDKAASRTSKVGTSPLLAAQMRSGSPE